MKWFNQEQGASLLLALMTMVVLSVLGITLGTIAINNVRLTSQEQDYQGAFYIAEAGLNQAYLESLMLIDINSERFNQSDSFFNQLIDDLNTELHNNIYSDYASISNESPYATITVDRIEGSGNKKDITLVSRGYIGERSQEVTRTFTVTWNDLGVLPYIPENTAGMIQSNIDLSTPINGDVYLNNNQDSSVALGWGSSISGTLFVPEGYSESLIVAPDNFDDYPTIETYALDQTYASFQDILSSFPVFSYPANIVEDIELKGGQDETITITSDMYIEHISIESNRTLTINTEGNTFDLYVDHLNIPQGNVVLSGGGTVNLFVSETFNIGQKNGGGSSQLNTSGDTRQLNVYYSGSTPIQIGGGNAINGSLFNLRADLTLTNGFSFSGYLVSGGQSLNVQGGANNDAFIIAPNATVRIEQGGTINGFVAANQLITSGGATLSVGNIDTSDFPFGEGGTGGNNNGNQVEVSSEPPVLNN